MAQYITKRFDRIDKICQKRYTTANKRVVEMVLDLNPALAKYDMLLPPGLIIDLPEIDLKISSAPVIRQVMLW